MDIKNFGSYGVGDVSAITRSNTQSNGSAKDLQQILQDFRATQQVAACKAAEPLVSELAMSQARKCSSAKTVRFLELEK